MKYTVRIAIDGRIDVDVEAKDFEEARRKALDAVCLADLNGMDFNEYHAIYAKREDRVAKDYW